MKIIMAKKQNKNWIKGAIRKPGSLTKTAKQHGAVKNGIDPKWLEKAAKGEGVSKKTAQRARLAKTLKKMRKSKGK
jgi:hypothetical protein